MAEVTRLSGVIVSVSGPAELDHNAPLKRDAKVAKHPQPGAQGGGGLLLDALAQQDLELVDSIPLTIPPAARPKKRGAPTPSSAITLDVPLSPDSGAVVLLEDEGEYRWIVDGTPLLSAAPKRGRAAPGRQIRFVIELKAAPPPLAIPSKRGGVKRNWLVDKLVGKVTAYIFRFAVSLFGEKVVEFLERKIERGLVTIDTPDPRGWKLLDDDAPLPRPLPTDRGARVLLVVHGTFSSTVGSFGALGVVPAGIDFLNRAHERYDAVLGFDHATLSVDPLANAKDILKRLRKIDWRQPPHIDMIAFSRGGLVVRSLIEQLMAGSGWKATIGRVVFVGCTNGGTQLAEPDNWRRFVDHYTNLALGATRILALIPGAQGVSTIASYSIRGVAVLVKSLAVGAITDKVVPGLAAMEPDGDFVTTINKAQPGQPTAADAQYFAVTTNFEARKALTTCGTPELPPKLLMRIADWGADELYGEANDLVVHVSSMTQFDENLGNFVKDKLDYEANGVVYHTNYFTHDTTAIKLIQWFELPQSIVGTLAYPDVPPPKRGPTRSAAAKVKPAEKAARPPFWEIAEKAAKMSLGKAAPLKSRSLARSVLGGVARPNLAAPILPELATDIGQEMAPSIVKTAPPLKRSTKNAVTAKKAVNPLKKNAHVECHFRAEMDSNVAVNKIVSVDVTIARSAPKVSAGRTGESVPAIVEAETKLIVQIAERRNFRVDGERRVEVEVPGPGEEVNLSFDVTGLVQGEGELWVQVRQGPVPLVTLKLKPQIVATAGAGPTSRLLEKGEIVEPSLKEEPLDQLLITENKVDNDVQYHYLLQLPSLNIREHFESKVIQDRGARITKILNDIGNAWAGTEKDQVEAFEYQLRSIGAEMFTELMPREMQELLWDKRASITSVQVSSMEPFIPWELVCLRDPAKKGLSESKFLGELGMVRWPFEGYPPKQIVLGSGRARYIIPTYTDDMKLEYAAGEEQMMKTLFNATPVKARALDVQRLLRTPGSFDLLHFAGHAEAAGDERADARLILDQQRDDKSTENALLAVTVKQTARLAAADGNRPIVVLNACESARMNRGFTSMGGFASAFVESGAGVFIGSQWSVGDAPARTFIEKFYKSFAVRKPGAKPIELREAVMKARQAARDGGDGTWLAYVVYGHPRAVVA